MMGAMPGVLNATGLARVIENETKRWAPKPGTASAATGAPAAAIAAAQKP